MCDFREDVFARRAPYSRNHIRPDRVLQTTLRHIGRNTGH
jgi:hypothetical protein